VQRIAIRPLGDGDHTNLLLIFKLLILVCLSTFFIHFYTFISTVFMQLSLVIGQAPKDLICNRSGRRQRLIIHIRFLSLDSSFSLYIFNGENLQICFFNNLK